MNLRDLSLGISDHHDGIHLFNRETTKLLTSWVFRFFTGVVKFVKLQAGFFSKKRSLNQLAKQLRYQCF